jgi:hypothetical protein
MSTPWNYNSTIGGAGTIDPFTSPYDPGSAMGNWWSGVQSFNNTTPYNYQAAQFDPSNPFGQTMINPLTGESFAITPGMQIQNQWGMQNQSDAALAAHGWVSPGSYRGINIGGQSFVGRDSQGNLNFNMGGLNSMFGAQGQGGDVSGYGFTDYPQFQEYDASGNQIGMVDPYQVSDFAQNIVDTNAVINAALPGINEQQDIGFANAANRAGQSGFAMSDPYVKSLGGVARNSANDIAALTEQYRYGASEALAERRMQEELQQRALEQASWEAQQQINIATQQANQQAAFQAWMAENQYGQNQWLNQNQLGMEDYWNQQSMNQDWQLQQQQAQAALAAQMMGTVMGQLPQGMP